MSRVNTLKQEFKDFHRILDIISVDFKIENDILYARDGGQWRPLSYRESGSNKFYTKSVLKRKKKFPISFMRALGLEPQLTKPTPKEKSIPIPKAKAAAITAPVPKAPTMTDIREEMLSEYLLDAPISEDIKRRLPSPLKPHKLSLYFEQTPGTIGNFLRGFQMDIPQGHQLENDPLSFLEAVKLQIIDKLKTQLRDLGGIKFNLGLKINMRKENQIDGTFIHDQATFYNEQTPLTNEDEIDLDEVFSILIERVEKYLKNGSNWTIERIETLWLNIAKYQPLRGGSYIDLPKYIKDKKAVINVKNIDSNCLRWSLRSALFSTSNHSDRPSSYPVEDGLNFDGILAPTPISQIKKVERQNNLAINVFGVEKGVRDKKVVYNPFPLQLSKQPDEIPRINLLLIDKEEDKDNQGNQGNQGTRMHYAWIKDLNRLLYDQNLHKSRTYFCERCLHGYSREDLLEQHKPECRGHGKRAIGIQMPTKEKSILKFVDYQKQLKVPYIIYADFESIINKIR